MAEKEAHAELTSTIHLGSRVDSASSIGATHIDEHLASLSAEEREVLQKISPEDAMLIIHRGPAKGARYLLTGSAGAVRVGRAPDSEVFLDDVTVSRKHASIALVDRKFLLKDLGSLNGTYVNGEARTEISLTSGDEIQIGKFHMLFFGGK